MPMAFVAHVVATLPPALPCSLQPCRAAALESEVPPAIAEILAVPVSFEMISQQKLDRDEANAPTNCPLNQVGFQKAVSRLM